MRICSAGQMRELDKIATDKYNIPSIVLMENAALACVSYLLEYNSFVVVCGKGNNGGDGLSIARQLINKGKNVKIYLTHKGEFYKDALINYNIIKSMGIECCFTEDFDEFCVDLKNADCTVDAIFGTGLHGGMDLAYQRVIEAVNTYSNYVLSVDVPSGIDSDSGAVETISVKADMTVTFAAYKTGMLMYPAADYTGVIKVSDISIPKAAFEEQKIMTESLDSDIIKSILPQRYSNSQKGDYGKIFVIGGKRGMAGAVTMACNAAFRVGAGIVTACVPNEINDIVQINSQQTMTYCVDFEKDTDKIISKMNEFDVILFGNGIGREEYVKKLLVEVLKNARVPVVIDADGLYAICDDCSILKGTKCNVILTPHSMEMARLIKKDVEFVEKNRLLVSKQFASEYGVTLVLKGNHTIITAPDGMQYVNLCGNSGMATAGSGDVLAGMTAGFACTAKNNFDAALLSVYIHAKAGDFVCSELSEYSVTAPDIIDAISHILPVEN